MKQPAQTGFNDSQTDHAFGRFLVPSWVEVVALAGASLIILLIGNSRLLWETAINSAQVSPQTASQTLQPHFDLVTNYLHQDIFGKLAVLVVWAFIGSIAYMIVWSVQSTYHQAKEDVEASNYVQSAGREGYWHSKIAHYAYLVCAWFVLIIFLLVFLVVALPLANSLAAITIGSYQKIGTYKFALTGWALIAVCLYCLTRLWRTATYVFKIR